MSTVPTTLELSPDDLMKTVMEGIKDWQKGTEIDPSENLCLAIIGLPKSGKSWLGATIAESEGITFVADFDNRAESLKGKKNIVVKTYQDQNQIRPVAMKNFETDIDRFKYNKKNGKPIPRAYILDSITYMKKASENEIFEQSASAKITTFRELKTGTGIDDKVRIPQGYDIINGVRDHILYCISELRALGHVICVFHERDETDKKLSTPDRTVYTGKITVDPPYLSQILTVFNDVMRIQTDHNGKYKVWTRSTRDFNGATSLNGLELEESPNIAAMLTKHRATMKK
jgi:hypothetical protein